MRRKASDDGDAAVNATNVRFAGALVRMDRHRHVAELSASLNAADLRLLWLLSDENPRTLREISEVLDLEQSTVNRQVNAAIAGGYLRRYKESGQAAQLVEATTLGQRTFAKEAGAALDVYQRALETLGEDAEAFVKMFETVVESYGQAVRG